MADYDGITSPAYQTDKPWSVEHPAQNLNVPDVGSTFGTSLSTGDLRRKYNFGNTFTTLSAKRDPFLHLLNRIKGGKVATDDPFFKFTTKRNIGPQHRYGYIVGADEISALTESQWSGTGYNSGTVDLAANDWSAGAATTAEIAVGKILVLKMAGDYLYGGNRRNAYGNATQSVIGGAIQLLADDTAPRSFLKDQVIKINMKTSIAAENNFKTQDYMLCQVVYEPKYETDNKFALIYVRIIKAVANTTTHKYIASHNSGGVLSGSLADYTPTELEAARCYPVGTGYKELSGYGTGWKDQPWSTDAGMTQIFKTTMMMSNRSQATVLKYEPSEWRRVWGSKLQEHAWDIAQTGYFGVQNNDTTNNITYTQGAVDYIINNGNTFAWSSTYTTDDFMNDMSIYKDPRTDLGGQIAYFCNSEVWNWMQKQGGFLKNNSEMSTNYEFQLTGRGVAKGVPFSKISTVYGDMNLVRDVHLDGTNVKILAVNLNGCRYRPLIGNGVNRDTTVYVGVKTIENSGEDYRVDLIQTDAGFEFSQPETHAIWL
tara:strand:- start:6656 stop:8278 length:1623 start_codon:yes stop_codon:yes gene_type:complete